MLFKKNNSKIIIGMSGGVDSSVAAAILKKQGYDVTGVFLMLPQCQKNSNNIKDVKRVCKILNIPLKIIDARKRFKDTVIEYFIREYKNGRTPNPCVFCNENFKFKILFDIANEIGADYVATGHYARLRREIPNPKSQIPNLAYRQAGNSKIQNSKFKTVYKLFGAEDKNKDQSYFLYRLKQEQLPRLIFPLGKYKKEDVKKIAKKIKLPVAKKPESQDVCFLSGTSVDVFLRKNIKSKSGEIVNEKGKILGKHSGLALYTAGQRKGINIGGTGPYYVLDKDYKKNRLIVTNNKKNLALFSKEAVLKDANWIFEEPKFPFRTLVRTRYRNPLVYATIIKKKEDYLIEFESPQRAITPGQSVVFYGKSREVLGGGIIN